MGVEGTLAVAFCDALLGYGAQAAWVEEAIPEGGVAEPIFDDPVQGRGREWVKAVWHNCRIVALFEPDNNQVHQLGRTIVFPVNTVTEAFWQRAARVALDSFSSCNIFETQLGYILNLIKGHTGRCLANHRGKPLKLVFACSRVPH